MAAFALGIIVYQTKLLMAFDSYIFNLVPAILYIVIFTDMPFHRRTVIGESILTHIGGYR